MYTRTFVFLLLIQFYLSTGIVWQRHRGRQFLLVRDKLNWFDAQTVCSSLGGRLAHADTSSVNEFLITLTDRWSFVWIGGADIHKEGEWIWYNPEKQMEFTYWHPTGFQPNNGRVSNCLTYWHNSGAYKWADEPCGRKSNFICEKISEITKEITRASRAKVKMDPAVRCIVDPDDVCQR